MEATLAPKHPNPYCYDDPAKRNLSRDMRSFYRRAAKVLPGFEFKVRFNPGGIAVWGETYAHIYLNGKPVVEAYDTDMGVLVRQWDGHYSGANHYTYQLDSFVWFVRELAAKPFVRF